MAYFQDKNRTMPAKKATPLSVSMGQGGGYENGPPAHGLSTQMNQGGEGYKHPFTVGKLREKMGQ